MMTEQGEGPESCTAMALWMPVGAGQGVLSDLVWGVTAAILLCPCGMGVCLGATGTGEDTVRVLPSSWAWTLKGHGRLLGPCAGLTPTHTEGT